MPGNDKKDIWNNKFKKLQFLIETKLSTTEIYRSLRDKVPSMRYRFNFCCGQTHWPTV